MDRHGDDFECSEKFANSTHPHFLDFIDLDLPNGTGFVMPVYQMDKDYLFAKYCNHSVVADFAKLLEEHRFNCSEYGEQHPVVNWSLTCIYTIVFILGISGNLLTLAVIYKTPALHSHTNHFLASLAASDLLLLLVGVPADLHVLWRPNKSPDFYEYCKINSTLIGYFTNVSILTIVTLTAERYVAICYPFIIQSVFDKARLRTAIKLIWLIAFFPSLFIGMQFELVKRRDWCGRSHDSLGDYCDIVPSEQIPLNYKFELITLFMFVLPMLFILFCYIRILCTLSKVTASTIVHRSVTLTNSDSSSQLATFRSHNPSRSRQAQTVVMKMLGIVTLVFFACYLPFHIQRLIVHHKRQSCHTIFSHFVCWLLYPITGQLQYFSAALNPLIYNAMSQRFRAAFRFWLNRLFTHDSDGYEGVTQPPRANELQMQVHPIRFISNGINGNGTARTNLNT